MPGDLESRHFFRLDYQPKGLSFVQDQDFFNMQCSSGKRKSTDHVSNNKRKSNIQRSCGEQKCWKEPLLDENHSKHSQTWVSR